jgi:hypothetical protein
MITEGARPVAAPAWAHRPRLLKAMNWIAYGIVRVSMGLLGYGGTEWFGDPRHRRP